MVGFKSIHKSIIPILLIGCCFPLGASAASSNACIKLLNGLGKSVAQVVCTKVCEPYAKQNPQRLQECALHILNNKRLKVTKNKQQPKAKAARKQASR